MEAQQSDQLQERIAVQCDAFLPVSERWRGAYWQATVRENTLHLLTAVLEAADNAGVPIDHRRVFEVTRQMRSDTDPKVQAAAKRVRATKNPLEFRG